MEKIKHDWLPWKITYLKSLNKLMIGNEIMVKPTQKQIKCLHQHSKRVRQFGKFAFYCPACKLLASNDVNLRKKLLATI